MVKKRFVIPVLIVILAAVVVLGGALWFRVFVPRFVTNAVNNYLSDVGTVGEVDVYVWGDVVLRDIEIPAKPGRSLSGRVDVARVRLSLPSLVFGAVDERAIKDIAIDGFELVIHSPTRKGKEAADVNETEKTVRGDTPGTVTSAFEIKRDLIPVTAVREEPPADLEKEYEKTVPAPPAGKERITPEDFEVCSNTDYSFDCDFSAVDGKICMERGGDELPLLTDVVCDGRIEGDVLSFILTAVPIDGTSFQAEGDVAVDATAGSAKYTARGLKLPFLLDAFGRPKWLASASGAVEIWGKYGWTPGLKPRHDANGRLEDGELEFTGGKLATNLTDVDADFELSNERIKVPSGGRFTAVGARWWVEGTLSARYVDLKFKSERMPLQNVVDMVVGGGVVQYPGDGYATIRLTGAADDPAVYVKVQR
jgi:hypothetical protein